MRVCPRRSHDEAKKRGCVGALACLPTLHNNFPDIPPPPSSTPPAQKSPIFIKKANLCLPLELHSQRQAILQSNPQPVFLSEGLFLFWLARCPAIYLFTTMSLQHRRNH